MSTIPTNSRARIAAVLAALTGVAGASACQASPAAAKSAHIVIAAAAQPTTAELEQQVASLKQQLANLQAQQDDMLKMLAQLTDLAQGKKPAAEPAVAPSPITTISTKGLQVEGPSNAKVAMVEFTDFECTYCGQYAREIYPRILANYVRYGKIQYFYHPMPLNIHPHSVQAAEAAQCAADQGKFWEMHDSLFANQNALTEPDFLGRAQALGLNVQKFSDCMLADKYADGLRNGEADWESRGVKGTPTFFIGILQPDGTLKVDYTINGAMSYDTYQKDLDAELAKG